MTTNTITKISIGVTWTNFRVAEPDRENSSESRELNVKTSQVRYQGLSQPCDFHCGARLSALYEILSIAYDLDGKVVTVELSEAMTIVWNGSGDAPRVQIDCETCGAKTSVKVSALKRVSTWADFWFAMQRANRLYGQHRKMFHD